MIDLYAELIEEIAVVNIDSYGILQQTAHALASFKYRMF